MSLARPFIASAIFLLVAGAAAAIDNLTAGLCLSTGALGFALIAWFLVVVDRRWTTEAPLLERVDG